MDIEFLLENPKGRCNSRYIKIHYPDDYNKILEHPGDSFTEKLYNYLHNDPDHICPVCGKPTPFRTITYGYSQFCSVKCSYGSKLRLDKIKKTVKERYGVDNASQSQEIKDKKKDTATRNYGGVGWASNEISEKSKKAIRARYGVDNASQNDDIKKKKIETCSSHYDGGYSSQEIRNKIKQTCIERYGVECIFARPDIRKKIMEHTKNRMCDIHDNLLGYTDDGLWIINCDNPGCTQCSEKCFSIPQQTYHDRLRNHSVLCTKLMPIGSSNRGTTIELFIRDILDRNGIEYVTNTRDIIYPKELDIYIPSKNMAIECNGVYWHSRKDAQYHLDKYNLCKTNNIQLITIWEDWIRNKPQIVESLILNKLGRTKSRLYARKCEIRTVDSKEATNFLNENHIQGRTNSEVKIGLYHEGQLVSLMTFNHKRGCSGNKYHDDKMWELSRFCSMLNTVVVGGAAKLLKYFISTYHPNTIYSFASHDISTGALYEKLGFHYDSDISGTYWYIEPISMKRYHRTSFCKDAIVDMGWRNNKEGWTESEVTAEKGLLKIFDTGMSKYLLNI